MLRKRSRKTFIAALVHAPQELRRGRAVYQLVRGVGGGEAVMDDIPVAVVILRMETGQAERGGVGDGTG